MDRKLSIFAVGGFVLSTSTAFCQSPQPKPVPAEFELQIGPSKVDVPLGQPFTLTLPNGDKVEAVLRRKPGIEFSGSGISFTYPSDMRVQTERESGFDTFTVQGADSPLAIIQVYRAPIEDLALLKTLVGTMRQEYRKTGARIIPGTDRAVKRKVAGAERTGKGFDVKVSGSLFTLEIYAVRVNGRSVSITLQHDQNEGRLAKKQFATITESLK